MQLSGEAFGRSAKFRSLKVSTEFGVSSSVRESHGARRRCLPKVAAMMTVKRNVQATSLPQIQDKFVARLLETCSKADGTERGLGNLRESCWGVLESLYMPTTRNEDYRFTDLSPILKSQLHAPAAASLDSTQLEGLQLSENTTNRIVILDGVPNWELSTLTQLPEGMYVGSFGNAPKDLLPNPALGSLTQSRGGPFSVLNGVIAEDVVTVCVGEGVKATAPLHLLFVSSGGSSEGLSVSAPRVLVSCGPNSSVEVVEEYSSLQPESSSHLVISVNEIHLGQGAEFKHQYVQLEGNSACHMKGTLVSQSDNSSYDLTEVCVGGQLARHDLGIKQEGSQTNTVMNHFLLCGEGQTHDLHSRLALDHPDGEANQLHKCIVTHPSGRGVFDGNVKVNRFAQRSDAGQLSRNLLLVPKATVNVKPNLQIIADDVKCTHGCTVSDLSEEEVFYFRARGVDAETARQALVYSFGAEVIQLLEHKFLLERVDQSVGQTLKSAGLA